MFSARENALATNTQHSPVLNRRKGHSLGPARASSSSVPLRSSCETLLDASAHYFLIQTCKFYSIIKKVNLT